MIKKILIAGGGSSGWMTASYLSKHLSDVEITLIESSDIPIIGVGESTIVPIRSFMESLGLKEKDWMPKCNATYKSSICFKDFYKVGDPEFWYPFSTMEQIEGQPLNRFWLNKYFTDPAFKNRHLFYEYCYFATKICEYGATVANWSVPLGYAYHIDSGLLGDLLKNYSREHGVIHVVDNIVSANLDDNGNIKSLSRENGEDLDADLFIDCTGFASLLMDKTLKEPFDYYSDCLFNDKAVAISTGYEDKNREMSSYTKCTAVSSGWIWRIPLYQRLASGYVYSSSHLSSDEAETELRRHIGEERTKDARALHINIRVGKHERTWVKNCIAIGLSGGFLEPLESTGLQIVQGQVDVLMKTLVANNNEYSIGDIRVFNDSVTRLYELIRDFLVCHYALTSREDSAYWKDVKYTTRIPDSLSKKLQLARIFMPDKEYIDDFDDGSLAGFNFNDGWMCILTGMNFLPFDHASMKRSKRGPYHEAVTRNMPVAEQRYQALKNTQLTGMPSHYQWLKSQIYNGVE